MRPFELETYFLTEPRNVGYRDSCQPKRLHLQLLSWIFECAAVIYTQAFLACLNEVLECDCNKKKALHVFHNRGQYTLGTRRSRNICEILHSLTLRLGLIHKYRHAWKGGKSEKILSVTRSESGQMKAWQGSRIHWECAKTSVTRLNPNKTEGDDQGCGSKLARKKAAWRYSWTSPKRIRFSRFHHEECR